MGWQNDWLYQRVFDLVEDVWQKAERETRRLPAPHVMPDYLLVTEYSQADNERARLVRPELRVWKYDGSHLVPLCGEESHYCLNLQPVIRGMYYSTGMTGFHIAKDRRTVVWNMCLGPLYGRGLVYRVRGQGKRGMLEPHEGAIGWIS
jgi:hypothetical protein